MEKSQSIVEISKALVAFHKEVPAVKKSEENPYFKSKYASLENIIATVEPILSKNDLTFVQFPSGEHGLTTILMHVSGEFFQDTYTMKPSKDDPQGNGSAISYQKRYALAAVLGLKIEDEDDDGNEASGHGKTPARAAAPQESPAVKFAKAKKMIEESRNVDGLHTYLEQLKRSTTFTAAQKKTLEVAVNDRLNSLQGTDGKTA